MLRRLRITADVGFCAVPRSAIASLRLSIYLVYLSVPRLLHAAVASLLSRRRIATQFGALGRADERVVFSNSRYATSGWRLPFVLQAAGINYAGGKESTYARRMHTCAICTQIATPLTS